MPYLYYPYDWTLLILIPPMLLALYAQFSVKNTFNKFSRVFSMRGVTGSAVAREILDRNGLRDVRVEHISGNLTDHFDPSANVVRLSDATYNNTSVAAIGVAAHEVGHAIQHQTGYAPVKIRTALVKVTNISASLSYLLIFIGLIMATSVQYGQIGFTVAVIGVAMFAMLSVFQLVTLPVEFNASARALRTLEDYNILQFDELDGAKKVLRAAALTYVAALVSSLASLLRLILIVLNASGRNRRN